MPTPADLERLTDSFVSELARASSGEKTSLPFLIHTIPDKPLVRSGELFQGIVVGGSEAKFVKMRYIGGKTKLVNETRVHMPVFHTKEDFLDFVGPHVDRDVRVVGLNFAYPLQPMFDRGILDGILVNGTKEHVFAGLVGKPVGRELEEYMARQTSQKIRVTSANDTICLLMSALSKAPRAELVAGILGTGMNFAFFLPDGGPVNLEAASFNKFPHTQEGAIVDKKSLVPGASSFEKEVAGGWLFKQYNAAAERLGYQSRLADSLELSTLAATNSDEGRLARQLLERSSAMVACQIAGIARFLGHGITVVMEGSLYWKASGYKEHLKKQLARLVPNYQVQIIAISDSDIVGSGKLVTL